MKMGELARTAGIPAGAIRFYERIGVLPSPARENGIRSYGVSAIEQLQTVAF
jgi:DNA-binding transcriptional MerR regulator